MHDLSSATVKYTHRSVLTSQFGKPSRDYSYPNINTQPVPLAGAAAAERAKHRDKNSSVLLFEAVLLLKIVQGGAWAVPDWLCSLQLLLRLDPAR